MELLRSLGDLRSWRTAVAVELGFVPTMGALHEGHVSLVRRSAGENDASVASVFVNPIQFGEIGDLERYPRDLEGDCRALAAAGCTAVFAPSAEGMYPPGFQTWIVPGPIAEPLEGAARPGHFQGVATVVVKLLNLVRPRRAYFGEKDAQQLAVIRRVVQDLDLGVEVVSCPTVRESDGLAMSSRNALLSPGDRRAATVLHRSLEAAAEAYARRCRDAEALRSAMREVLSGEPAATVEYVSVADPNTLEELDAVSGSALVSLAVRIGGTRLIDNRTLGEPGEAPCESRSRFAGTAEEQR